VSGAAIVEAGIMANKVFCVQGDASLPGISTESQGKWINSSRRMEWKGHFQRGFASSPNFAKYGSWQGKNAGPSTASATQTPVGMRFCFGSRKFPRIEGWPFFLRSNFLAVTQVGHNLSTMLETLALIRLITADSRW